MRKRRTALPRPALRCGLGITGLLMFLAPAAPVLGQQCARNISADVVALDVGIWYNRLGAHDPAAMIFALKRDVVAKDGSSTLEPGNVQLREGIRPRPLTLRMNEGDCLQVTLTNLVNPVPVEENLLGEPEQPDQPATRAVSIHVTGMQLVNSIEDDGSFVGKNPSSLVDVGATRTYTLFGEKEGTYLLYSVATNSGGDGNGGTIARGLFGAVNVEPPTAEWYRNQLTHADFQLAIARDASGNQILTPDGQPVVDYDAVYPAGHPRAGDPILKILHNNEIIYGDLRAIITGPDKGFFDVAAIYPEEVAVYDAREEPFREFTIIFHDEIGIVQALDFIYEDPVLGHTTHSGRDAFAINYGTGGIGSEIIGNRFRIGPMWDCNECKYEEFFLSSWPVGDPAMPVDIPADADLDGDGNPDEGPKATRILYPRDPSNVYQSYLNDRVKFRNLHAGPKEHHIFHLHAHQWLHTPNSDNSNYLDSQAIGPGGMYTYEIAFDGSGNRPLTPGDAIFHCHFYPHFAQGMWALWRNHDVYETGTPLDENGRPVAGARAWPDGEIPEGIPIPAIVPLPRKPLPPMPGTLDNPGYPFFIPGIAGHRAPHPPLDLARDENTGELLHGGLHRHVVRDGEAEFPFPINRLDFRKENITLVADSLPEEGTPDERAAMDFHSRHFHETFTPDPNTFALSTGQYETNGLPAINGAPYADPCRTDDTADPTGLPPRLYLGASIQVDAIHNKAGWHYPQHRMFALWDDVLAFERKEKAPQPLFMRVNSGECLEYHLVNLIPHEYNLDDFQVLTPTDVIGQHIHLVKFDVTSSDGAANGFNYEDGSFAPEEVTERIRAIRRHNKCEGIEHGTENDPRDGTFECPVPKAHPFFGAQGPNPDDEWLGAQETIQRWWADPIRNTEGVDRQLRAIFTHDHFSPSTHQQAGLYAGVVSEPTGSRWRDPETGEFFGDRFDGGPTDWHADILTVDPDSSYREFLFQVHDFALSYTAEADLSFKTFTDEVTGHTTEGIADPANAINPPGRFQVGLPFLLAPPVDGTCPGGVAPPCPEVISADDPGSLLINYRNEPVALRVRDPGTNTQAAGEAGDLGFAFQSRTDRADARFNTQPGFYQAPLSRDVRPGDPFTPMMRGYEADRVKIKILVGAHEEEHNFAINGVAWLFESADPNSGWRSSQMMGISEKFQFEIPEIPGKLDGGEGDHLYRPSASVDGVWTGMWGLLRTYRGERNDLLTLPSNPDARADKTINSGDFDGVCPKSAPFRKFNVTAVLAKNALPDGTLVYNPRTENGGPLHDPTAILYVRSSDLDKGKLKAGVPVEPLVLRANAGDCIELTLVNRLPKDGDLPDLDGFNTMPMIINEFNANQVKPSKEVGLHMQLGTYDVFRNDGMNVGHNKKQTLKPDDSNKFLWYAGLLEHRQTPDGEELVAVPVEFGAVSLISADPIKHSNKGAVGALIIEPKGATWVEDADSRMSATVTKPDGTTFRDFAVVYQDDINLRFGSDVTFPQIGPSGDAQLTFAAGDAVPTVGEVEDPEDSGGKALNYRTEPIWFRMGFSPASPFRNQREVDFSAALSNTQIGGDPHTPVFVAQVGDDVRLRVMHPAGHMRNGGFNLFGHWWQEQPWQEGSTVIGFNPLSLPRGVQTQVGPTGQWNILPQNGAGGLFGVPGDYLYRNQASFQFNGGMWGILRVLQ